MAEIKKVLRPKPVKEIPAETVKDVPPVRVHPSKRPIEQ